MNDAAIQLLVYERRLAMVPAAAGSASPVVTTRTRNNPLVLIAASLSAVAVIGAVLGMGLV